MTTNQTNASPLETLGPLNRAQTFKFQPGPRLDGRLTVTKDGRVLLNRAGGENYLLMNGSWYAFISKHHRLPEDTTAKACIRSIPADPLAELFGRPEAGEVINSWGLESRNGFFPMDEKSARQQACEARLGYWTGAWVKVRELSDCERDALNA